MNARRTNPYVMQQQSLIATGSNEPDTEYEMSTAERRREFLVGPGEGVALSPDLDSYVDRYERFLDATGLTPADVVASPVVRIPIPQGVKDSHGHPLRWDGVKLDVLWHPFFWLPASVALRAHVLDESGVERVETSEEYLIRVIVQCVSAGLLDVDSGTWLDVPSSYGIDVDAPDVRARLDQWERGASDPLFDQIDLTERFSKCGIDSEMVRDATSQTPLYVFAQWAYTAEHLGRTISDLQEDDRAFVPELHEQHDQTMKALITAYSGFSGGDLIGETQTREQVQSMINALEEPNCDVGQIRAQLLQLSARVHVATKPYLDQVNFAASRAREAA